MVGKKFTFQILEKVEFKYLEEFKENNKNAYVIFIIKKILKEVFICKSNTRLIERLCTRVANFWSKKKKKFSCLRFLCLLGLKIILVKTKPENSNPLPN